MRYLNSFLLVLLLAGASAIGGEFQQIVVIGDSMSDTGNQLERLGYPSSPYFNGRLTNGPNWLDVLADHLALPEPTPSCFGGTNYAQAGAQAGPGVGTLPGQPAPNGAEQIRQLKEDGVILSESTLVVVWIGYNNLAAGQDPGEVSDFLKDHITELYDCGARNFFVGDFVGPGGKSLSQKFATCRAELTEAHADLEFAVFSFGGMANDIFSNPQSFGLVELHKPACADCDFASTEGGTVIADDPDTYLMWDPAHPSARIHQEVGNRAMVEVSKLSVQTEPLLGDANLSKDVGGE